MALARALSNAGSARGLLLCTNAGEEKQHVACVSKASAFAITRLPSSSFHGDSLDKASGRRRGRNASSRSDGQSRDGDDNPSRLIRVTATSGGNGGAKSTLAESTTPSRGKTRIHDLLERNGLVFLPGCYDALSAAILQKSGFSAGFISGYATSASMLGKPDFGLLTPPEMAHNARQICNAAPKIPIIADADTGGGNALNVQRTIRDLIAAGAAGCFLEDQAWPKKCGHMRGKQVIPAEEHAMKIAAARDAIGNADFFLVARTDARATSKMYGLEDAISRANLYMEAGADASFVEAPRDEDELREIGRRTRGPRLVNMLEGGATPLLTPDELMALGFQLVVHPLTTLYAATRAMVDVCKELKEKGTARGCLDKLATFSEFNDIVGLEEMYADEARYSLSNSPSYSPIRKP